MTTKFIGPMVMVACLTLSAGCAETSSQEMAQSSGEATSSMASSGSGASSGTSTIAAGAAGDTLNACLARIPASASAGQRMIAEQSCGRDQGDRKSIQAVPGR